MSNPPIARFEGVVQPWGNSLGLRITRPVSELAHIQRGTKVSIEVTEEGLLIRPIQPPATAALPFSEEELLSGLTPYTAHADELPALLLEEQGG